VDLVSIVKELEQKLSGYRGVSTEGKPVKVAVMGCVVNGPGEALDADIGVAFGDKTGMFFKKGKAVRKVQYKDCVSVLLKEMEMING
jgi:(E)-4-hydroxy-3-methylbut-2-enyl-diphosphate synthase